MTGSSNRELLFIPEIVGLDARSSLIRIPPELDVPLTPRVRRLIDSNAFRRLADVSQLGFVRLVYPGATHTRFEHSLGVYRITLLLLKRLAYDERFSTLVRVQEAETLILAALLHDVGHFPYCHLLEDLKIQGFPSHEEAACEFLFGELEPLIREDWQIDPANVVDVLLKRSPQRLDDESDDEYSRRQKVFHLLASILSGPVDVDKMDYLMRDSHAAGVPYGKNYDLDRLVGSICLNANGDGIAISYKGKTAAELMVFARYVMFSEVYWHHAARSATVMFQRVIDNLIASFGSTEILQNFRNLPDSQIANYLTSYCCPDRSSPDAMSQDDVDDFYQENQSILQGIFGTQRRLYKRIRQFSSMEAPELYQCVAGRPFDEIRKISQRLAYLLGISSNQLLIDAPPADKEVEFKIDVFYPNENVYRPLSSVSPVVRSLAHEQFDDYVKRVRLFASPDVAERLKKTADLDLCFMEAIRGIDGVA